MQGETLCPLTLNSKPKGRMSSPVQKIADYKYQINTDYQNGMRVPGVIFADDRLIEHIISDNAFKQVANVATLPGVERASMAMPDIHWGYGFPIGGFAAMDAESGVVSPGGVGSDINCGVRLLRSDLTAQEVRPRLEKLIDTLYALVPCGVGSTGKIRTTGKDLDKVLTKGAKWAVDNGYGWNEDVERTEENGCIAGADPKALSQRALKRGYEQVGTLGSGNHFLEVQLVEEIFDEAVADAFGLFAGQICCMIHSGSRGLGYQVCEDFAKGLIPRMSNYGITVPDRQLACAPINSSDGKRYLAAMACAANYAWANRQAIMHWCREAFEQVFGRGAAKLGLHMLYDVAHNIAKFEEHEVGGKTRKFLVHRKGATRAFGPNRKEIPEKYRKFGQPVIIPGDMGTASYILTGTDGAMRETFGSTCHGAGRQMSRKAAIRATSGRRIDEELKSKGIYTRWRGRDTLREEVPEAYKNIDHVVEVVEGAGISKKVARLLPMGVVKG